MDDFDKLVVAVKAHKKQCFHKDTCELCKIKFSSRVCSNVHQCSYCDKVYDSSSTSMFMYECICEKSKTITLCDTCEDANVVFIVRKFDSGLDDEYQYDFDGKSFDEWGCGIYLDTCCHMTENDIKNHRENCFHKSLCDICRVPTDKNRDDQQCDYCTEFCHYLSRYWCRCEREVLHLCIKCIKLNLRRIIEEPFYENCDDSFDCRKSSIMTKACKK